MCFDIMDIECYCTLGHRKVVWVFQKQLLVSNRVLEHLSTAPVTRGFSLTHTLNCFLPIFIKYSQKTQACIILSNGH